MVLALLRALIVLQKIINILEVSRSIMKSLKEAEKAEFLFFAEIAASMISKLYFILRSV
jgi:hypothetical protein